MIAAIEQGFEERGLARRWEVFFPPVGGDFEVRGEASGLIVEFRPGWIGLVWPARSHVVQARLI